MLDRLSIREREPRAIAGPRRGALRRGERSRGRAIGATRAA